MLTLLYPCLTLAMRVDPLVIAAELAAKRKKPTLSRVKRAVQERIGALLQPIIDKHSTATRGQPDQTWYWASLALLDRTYYGQETGDWLHQAGEHSWPSVVAKVSPQGDDTSFADYYAFFTHYHSDDVSLGCPPRQLVDVLTEVALGAPGVAAARALVRLLDDASRVGDASCENSASTTCRPWGRLLGAASQIAMGFRTMFRMPTVMNLVRHHPQIKQSRYWRRVLEYCVDGNLQSVLDEYVHVLREMLGLVHRPAMEVLETMAQEIWSTASLRTVSLSFDEVKVLDTAQLAQSRLRCRFALRFGNDRDDDGQETRAELVRAAFNSPFRPFVLATTSIGQEGLDFHLYCHEIYHWNLPSNPIDLEQREGRVHRYKCLAIRRNVAQVYGLTAVLAATHRDPWESLFGAAVRDRSPEENDLVPFWVFTKGDWRIVRHLPMLPMSRELQQLEDLQRKLVLYRLAFGQPRQEELVAYLQSHVEGLDQSQPHLTEFLVNLEPRLIAARRE